ncbi:MAG: hypothetical protein ACFCUM_12330 [Bacteroidales bacterium]|jgi:hypothetical protein
MDESVRVNNILSQISKLDYKSRLYLIKKLVKDEKLVKDLRKNEKRAKPFSHKLTDLNSLGSEIWKDIDIDHYVQQERQWE